MNKDFYVHDFAIGQIRLRITEIQGNAMNIAAIPTITIKTAMGDSRFLPRSHTAISWKLPE